MYSDIAEEDNDDLRDSSDLDSEDEARAYSILHYGVSPGVQTDQGG